MRISIIAFFLLFSATLWAQSNYATLNEDYYHTIDRYEIKAGRVRPEIFTAVKPYKRSDIIAFLDSVDQYNVFGSAADQFNLDYLRNDSWEWSHAPFSDSKKPFLKSFYKKKSDLFYVDVPEFDLHLNPVLYLGAGNDSRNDEMPFINTRGIEIRGMIDRKVGFYTYLTDNQAILPSYVFDQMAENPVIPHEGFWKDFKDGTGVDFFQARGYVTFEATKHINLQFGHDRFFIGNGYRSLIFSDHAPPAMFLKGNVKIWRINYLFSLHKMTADAGGTQTGGSSSSSAGYPDKFVAFHHLSVNIGKKLNIGVFESVIYSPDDSLSTGEFRFDYLNPIIFYRSIEQQNGSTDNAILGFDFKWNAVKKLSFYGQFVLDEFVLENIREGNGWWANKFAIQGGAKYIDAFNVSNLDLQGEVNIVRPYTYSHNSQYNNYSNYRQAIAHPLGANFTELVGIVRYQPVPRLNITGKLIMTNIGRDSTGVKYNWGSDILKNNANRKNGGTTNLDYGNTIGQGFANDILFGSLTASYHLKHNLFIDVNVIVRKSESELPAYNNNTTITSLALRWNIARRLYEF